MSRPSYVRWPTENAAIRAVCRSARPLPPVTALMAALIEANDRNDREGVTLAAHRAVRVSEPGVGE